MKTYNGMILNEPEPDTDRYVIVHDSEALPRIYRLKERQDLYNHSPTGFSWGYNGSGPAQLALAILADATDDATALNLHQDFKEAFIARLDMDKGFSIPANQIEEWHNDLKQQQEPQ